MKSEKIVMSSEYGVIGDKASAFYKRFNEHTDGEKLNPPIIGGAEDSEFRIKWERFYNDPDHDIRMNRRFKLLSSDLNKVGKALDAMGELITLRKKKELCYALDKQDPFYIQNYLMGHEVAVIFETHALED